MAAERPPRGCRFNTARQVNVANNVAPKNHTENNGKTTENLNAYAPGLERPGHCSRRHHRTDQRVFRVLGERVKVLKRSVLRQPALPSTGKRGYGQGRGRTRVKGREGRDSVVSVVSGMQQVSQSLPDSHC